MAASNEYQSIDQMRTNFSQVLLSGGSDRYLFEPEYTEEEILQGKARQLYLYSEFHTQWQLNALYIKQTFNSKKFKNKKIKK